MAQFHCPTCGMPMTADEYHSGVCPACDDDPPVMADSRAASIPPKTGDTYDHLPSYRDPHYAGLTISPKWHRVYAGLTMFYHGWLLLFAVAGVVGLLCLLFSVLLEMHPARVPARLFGDLMCMVFVPIVVGVFGVGMIFLGAFKCCMVPRESRVDGLAMAALLFLLMTLLCVLSVVGMSGAGNPFSGDIWRFVCHASYVIFTGLFVFVLRGIAIFFDQRLLAARWLNYFLLTFVIFGLVFVIAFCFVLYTREVVHPPLPMHESNFTEPAPFERTSRHRLLLTSALAVVTFALTVWYVWLLHQTRAAMGEGLRLYKPRV